MENCAAKCPILDAASQDFEKLSLEVRIEMANVAIASEKISENEAAKRFRVPQSTLNDNRKVAGITGSGKPATLKERQKWHQDKADGMSIRQIAKKHGRDRGSVSKELKKDPPAVTPAPEPGEKVCEIVKKKKRALSRQSKGLEGLLTLERELQKSMRADQKNWQKIGRSVWHHNVQQAHDVISSNGCLTKHREILGLSEQASYLEVLDALEARAKSAMDSIQWLKYLSGYTDLPGGASTVN
jgi:hypothetical protein